MTESLHKKNNYRNRYITISVFSIGLLSCLLGILITNQGIGLYPDSAHYIDSARNILSGEGYVTKLFTIDTKIPQTHYPPLYPLFLTFFGLFGMSLISASKFLTIGLFIANSIIIVLLLRYFSKDSFFVPLFGGLFALFSPVILSAHSLALTEPLYLLLGTLSLYHLEKYIDSDKKAFLWSAAVLTGFAFLTRYIGFTLIITGFVGLLVLKRKETKEAFEDALLFSIIALVIFIPFLIRNLIVTGGPTSRELAVHFINPDHINDLLVTFSTWIIPGGDRFVIIPGQLIFVVLIAICAYGIIFSISIKNRAYKIKNSVTNNKNGKRYPIFFIVYIPVYLISILFSISFFDAATPLDDRTLSPIFISLLIFSVLVISRFIKISKAGLLSKIVKIGVIVIGVLYLAAGSYWIYFAFNNGRGYNNSQWRDPKVSNALSEILESKSNSTAVFSNDQAGIYFLKNKITYPISSTETNISLIDTIRNSNKYLKLFLIVFTFNPEFSTVHGNEDEWTGDIEKNLPAFSPIEMRKDFGKVQFYEKMLR